jgi:hypothetical protein
MLGDLVALVGPDLIVVRSDGDGGSVPLRRCWVIWWLVVAGIRLRCVVILVVNKC